jgi:GT2 family glycosyltransferase
VFHEDIGFRKCKILNEAIKIASGEILVFTDIDCIFHPRYLERVVANIRNKRVLLGRRVLLSEKLTQKIITARRLPKLREILFSSSRSKKYAFYFSHAFPKSRSGIWGCNWACCRKDVIAVNGFDEDFTSYGIGEDSDIDWRLRKIGVEILSLKHQLVMYHLAHPTRENAAQTRINEAMMYHKKMTGIYFCKNGIEK